MRKILLTLSAFAIAASVNAQQYVATNGTKNVLITDGTGAWCPYCADGIAKLDDLLSSHPKVIAAGVHNASSGRHDAMEFPEGEAWNNNWCVGPLGYPYGTVDCHFFGLVTTSAPGSDTCVGLGRGGWETAVNQAEGFSTKVDLIMIHSYDQATRKITVKVMGTALENLTGEYNINVWLTEDDVQGTGSGWDQANSENNTSGHIFYQKGSPMPNFKHQHVLRAMMGGTWGTSAVTDPASGTTFEKEFEYTIPGTYSNSDGSYTPNLDKMHLIGLVQKKSAGGTSNNKDINVLNSIEAKFFPWNATGINQVSNFAEVNIYPNPAYDYINVRANLTKPAETNVTITNAIGQVIFNQNYSAKGNLFGEHISLKNVNSGMYFITVTSNGTKHMEKVIVNK